MPRPRFERLSVERRDRILEAAAREFAVHGFEGATLNHILAAAGISKGAAYYYFDDKADLFATVVQHYWQHMLSHVAIDLEQLTAATFWGAVAELYRQPVLHCREQPWMFAVVKGAARPPDGVPSGDTPLARRLRLGSRAASARGSGCASCATISRRSCSSRCCSPLTMRPTAG